MQSMDVDDRRMKRKIGYPSVLSPHALCVKSLVEEEKMNVFQS